MPFRSEKQRRYLWKNHPKIARDWTDEHGSKPQPKKKAEGGSVKKVQDRLSVQDIKRAEEATKKNLTPEQAREIIERYKKSSSYLKGKEKAKEHREKLRKLLRKGEGYVSGWLGKKKGGGIDKYHRGRLSPEDIKRGEKATEGFKQIYGKLKREKRLPTKSELDQMMNALTGSKEALKIIKKKPELIGKKQGGAAMRRVKKTGPVRPIHIPWDEQKKKKHHFKQGGIARRPKRDTKHNPHMEPYRGSYISGKVDGKMLSNPSLRKYYKGLI